MASAPRPRKALTTAQESRLVRYLDDELLKLSGAFESRHSGTSRLPTLDAFLQALLPLHAFILTIPAVPPSAALRIAYYLNLTSFIPPALDGYTVLDETLDSLFETLARFDRGWVAVLRGEDWDSTTGQARPDTTAGAGSSGMRTTDRARLESLVKQVRAVLAISLGLPQFVPLENDPFLEMLQQRRDQPDLAGPLPNHFKQMRSSAIDPEGEDDDSTPSQASTPSLVTDESLASDADSAMSVDTVTDGSLTAGSDQDTVAMSGVEIGDDDDDDEDVDDADFEEVAPTTAAPPRFQHDRLPNAIVDAPEPDGSFEIHYEIPPPALHDGEITLENGATPIVGQRRGFDPDAEYPLSEEEGDPIVPRRQRRRRDDGEIVDEDETDGEEEEDGIEDTTRERLKHVFELTERALEELRAADTAGP
ncbi:hypothetical protein JCM10908_004188 [Rhodotorula pacifica]|uniref:uncharacterized protein n=1 Tax=Rhodotorula pacifica TaxID=1495444 RepID=UPI00316CC0FF